MGWWFRKRADPTSTSPLRESLFGDLPLSAWSSERTPVSLTPEAWASFARAEAELGGGNEELARDTLKAIVAMPGLESRHYLEAWHHLRPLAIHPEPGESKRILGVVLDVPVEGGWDVLAAYADHSARYLNHSSAAIIWERPDSRLDGDIDEVLREAHALASRIGPWEGDRPALAPGQARLSLLSPSGLHFGQAPFDALARDPNSAPVVAAATKLLVDLTNMAAKEADHD